MALIGLVAWGGVASAAVKNPYTVPASVWHDAGNPTVHYIDNPNEPGGRYVDGRIILNRAPGTNVSLRKTFFHELGHAYADHQQVNYEQYAAIRGLQDLDRASLLEDYAETFEWILTDRAYPRTGSFPYAFDNRAGPPTDWQVKMMRKDGLLP